MATTETDRTPSGSTGRAAVRPRPAWLRALGRHDPPLEVWVDGRPYQRTVILKHDSWAATAAYEGADGKLACKFHRQQSLGLLPMRWLGRLLARRESACLRALERVAGIPRLAPPVADGSGRPPLRHAVARQWIEGQPLMPDSRLPAHFFERLDALLGELHRRGMAYVDLHKRENVLAGDDGHPYLFDFQISHPPARGPLGRSPLGRWWLGILQRSDRYHAMKLRAKASDEVALWQRVERERPWWIRLHRKLAAPVRQLRRRLLVALGVRDGAGNASSEHFVEHALRTK